MISGHVSGQPVTSPTAEAMHIPASGASAFRAVKHVALDDDEDDQDGNEGEHGDEAE